MVANTQINMGYNDNPFIILPLNKSNNDGMTIKSSTPAKEFPDEFMNNLNDIKAADADGNNIISLWELQNFEGKTEFAQTVLEMMENFAQDFRYRKNSYFLNRQEKFNGKDNKLISG